METVIRKEYCVDEDTLVVHCVLEALYQRYRYTLPGNIRKQMENLINDTGSLFNENSELKNYDIVDEEYVLRVTYSNSGLDNKNFK